MFNKILIALSVVLIAQLGSATIITPDQLSTSFVAAGLVTEIGYTDTGGYKVLITDLVQGTDLTPAQAFSVGAVIVAKLMEVDDNHNAISVIGVSTTDGKIHYLEMNQDTAEYLATAVAGEDAGPTVLALVIGFNSLPTFG